MDDIRDTRPWFWILVAALAIVAILGLVLAVSANQENVNQKQVVDEATAQIKEELSGLDTAVEAANEFQKERDELAEQDRQRISRQVDAAVAEGQQQLQRLRRRVRALENGLNPVKTEVQQLKKSNANLIAGQESLRKSNSQLKAGQAVLETEVAQLKRQISRLQP